MSIINKIGLGTVQFGMSYGISNKTIGITTEEEVGDILRYCNEEGISILDTAAAYGKSEDVLGKFDLSNFHVVSKFLPLDLGESLELHLDQTLNRLKISSLYGYMAHRPLSLLKHNFDSWKQLIELREKKKVVKIGYSLNDPNELMVLLDNDIIPDIVQIPYNYLDNRFNDLLPTLKYRNCEVHSRSAFLQGLFFCAPHSLASYFDEIKPILIKLSAYGDRLPSLLLKWVLKNTNIDKVIIGINSLKQLRHNILRVCNEKNFLEDLGITVSDNILNPSKWPS